MKKAFAILLALVMIFSFAACGNGQTGEDQTGGDPADYATPLEYYIANGYECQMTSCDEETWVALYVKDGEYIKISAQMTPELYEEYTAAEEESDALEVIKGIGAYEVEDVSGYVPSEEELAQFKGMTLAELEAMGYENCGYWGDDGSYNFWYADDTTELEIYTEDGTVIDDPDNLTDADRNEIVIKEACFSAFAYNFLNPDSSYDFEISSGNAEKIILDEMPLGVYESVEIVSSSYFEDGTLDSTSAMDMPGIRYAFTENGDYFSITGEPGAFSVYSFEGNDDTLGYDTIAGMAMLSDQPVEFDEDSMYYSEMMGYVQYFMYDAASDTLTYNLKMEGTNYEDGEYRFIDTQYTFKATGKSLSEYISE